MDTYCETAWRPAGAQHERQPYEIPLWSESQRKERKEKKERNMVAENVKKVSRQKKKGLFFPSFCSYVAL
jgi:hypothetical protein